MLYDKAKRKGNSLSSNIYILLGQTCNSAFQQWLKSDLMNFITKTNSNPKSGPTGFNWFIL